MRSGGIVNLVLYLIMKVPMQLIHLTGLFLFLSLGAGAQSKVVAQISNFENTKGVCRACLFTSEEAFSGGGEPFRCVQARVIAGTVQAEFDNVPPGTYALFVLHDANSNNKMDKNFLGIPKEGYGASRNKLPFAAAPTFKDNRFEVSKNATVRLSIRLRNL
jgi:uncharacterized protein (DUF2141 family)